MASGVDGPDPALYLEQQKLAFDFVKHITALDTGTIVLSGTGLGLLMSVRRDPAHIGAGLWSFTTTTALIGLAGFLLGLTFLSLFAVRNWI